MIEVISQAECIGCDICVRVCPTNVFDAVPGENPVISRQDDCQTCFMCEAYCPVKAIYVAGHTHPAPEGSWERDEDSLTERGLFGKYREDLGWMAGSTPSASFATPLLAHKHISSAVAAATSKTDADGFQDPPSHPTPMA